MSGKVKKQYTSKTKPTIVKLFIISLGVIFMVFLLYFAWRGFNGPVQKSMDSITDIKKHANTPVKVEYATKKVLPKAKIPELKVMENVEVIGTPIKKHANTPVKVEYATKKVLPKAKIPELKVVDNAEVIDSHINTAPIKKSTINNSANLKEQGNNIDLKQLVEVVQLVMTQMNNQKSKAIVPVEKETVLTKVENNTKFTEKMISKSEEKVNENIQSMHAPKEKNPLDNQIQSLATYFNIDVSDLSKKEVNSLMSILNKKKKHKMSKMIEHVDSYNKVTTVQDERTESTDILSQIAQDITAVIDTLDSDSDSDIGYTSAIKKEVKIRKNAMRYVVVKNGDTLGKIAHKMYGDARKYKKIFSANPDLLRRADRIFVGQRLRVPH